MNAQLFGIELAWKARKAATTVEQAIATWKPSAVGYLTVRRAEAAVSARLSPPNTMQGLNVTTPPRPADRITALAGSADLSGFAPFLSPVMFFLDENLWPAMTLKVSLTAMLLTTLVVVGWYRGA